MNWLLDKSRPICPQISEQICAAIASGEIGPGERLLSVRDVAVAAGVNPNTVQKSFESLESEGVVYSVRGSGWYVSDNTENAARTVSELINTRIASFFDDMGRLGVSAEETKKYVKEWVE